MKTLIAVCIFLFTTFSSAQSCPQFAFGGEMPKTSEPSVLLCKKEFAIGYSTIRKVPLFVVQRLDAEKLTLPNAVDSATFKIDPTLPKEQQAALADFVGTGYDRGHQAPFEDNNHDADAAAESNYLTNVIPQHAGNNRGIWRVLEMNTRNAALDDILFVITGPIFDGQLITIGASKVNVPSKLYKIIINPRTKKSTTYIIPNASASSELLSSFISTRKMVQELTGMDPIPAITIIDETK